MKKLAEKRPKIKIIFSCLSSRREINRLCWIFWKRLLWNLCNDEKRPVEIMRKSWSFPKLLNLWVPNYFCNCSQHDEKERCYKSLAFPNYKSSVIFLQFLDRRRFLGSLDTTPAVRKRSDNMWGCISVKQNVKIHSQFHMCLLMNFDILHPSVRYSTIVTFNTRFIFYVRLCGLILFGI
jgi:hypothetical protein